MNTIELSNNERLRQLIEASNLTQVSALAMFNEGLGVRGLKESTWKGYFCDPSTRRFRGFANNLLEHAEEVFCSKNVKPR